uniref:Uncharacterized protein n=1 Tax=viral metagenome TaxID=1070528 RepID=A0A6C0C7Y4_9ZZZZ
MHLSLLKAPKNYLSDLIFDLLLQIIVNLDPISNLSLSMTSKYFNRWYVNKIIPPKPVVAYSTSNQNVNYLDKIEKYKQSHDRIKNLTIQNLNEIIPKHDDYEIGLKNLSAMVQTTPYSLHFYHHNGHERINKICEKEIEQTSKFNSFCSSCFRDPYQLLFMITILLLITVTTSWFLYVNMSYNLHDKDIEEEIIYRNALQKIAININENGYDAIDLPFDRMIERYDVLWFWRYPQREKCFHNIIYYKMNHLGLCFESYEEMCKDTYISSKYFDYVYQYYDSMYSMDEIKDIYLQIWNRTCVDDYHDNIHYLKDRTNKSQLDLFATSRISITDNCMTITGEIHKTYVSFVKTFYVSKITYNTTCIAAGMTTRPNFARETRHLLAILVLSWIIFALSALYGLHID